MVLDLSSRQKKQNYLNVVFEQVLINKSGFLTVFEQILINQSGSLTAFEQILINQPGSLTCSHYTAKEF